MAYSVPSGLNTFVPSHEASGSLVVGYSRNINKFKINRWMQHIPVKKSIVAYLNWYSQQGNRITSQANANLAGAQFAWQDGNDAPSGIGNLEDFQYAYATTVRYAFPFTVGNKAVEQADWNLLAAQGAVVAQQAMTLRTIDGYQAVLNSGATSNTATTLGGGKFDAGTPASPTLKPGLMTAAEAINVATMGVVEPTDLAIIMNPFTALNISSSQELTDNIKYLAGLKYVTTGTAQGTVDNNWGLPDNLFGFETIVEQTTVNSNAKGTSNTDTGSYVIPNGYILMVSKAGGLDGVEGAMSWSTLQGFFYEDFTVEQKQDFDNRRIAGRVVSDYTMVVSSQGIKSAYIITAAV